MTPTPLTLDTYLYFFRPKEHGPTPTKRELLLAIMAHQDLDDLRKRMFIHGSKNTVLRSMHWLKNHVGKYDLFHDAPLIITPIKTHHHDEDPLRINGNDLFFLYKLHLHHAFHLRPQERHENPPTRTTDTTTTPDPDDPTTP